MASVVSASSSVARTVASVTPARAARSAPMAPAMPRASAPALKARATGMAALSASAPRKATALHASKATPVMAAKNGDKKVCVITGANSGLGLATAKKLAASGEWYVVMACRDWCRTEQAARKAGMAEGTYEIMHLDLSALSSVRNFVETFKASGLPCDVFVANAAIYLPTVKEPVFSADGYEMSVATNHLGHFLLCNLMVPILEKSTNEKRMIILGSVTGNTNTVAGNVPPKADLGQLQGLKSGFKFPDVMIDGGEFDGAKAYKDSKVCNMLTMREMHERYHESTGIKFMSLYPGCIAETGLFRNHYQLFRTIFPPFQKYITKGYVSEEEAGNRLAKVVGDPSFDESKAYWSWDSNSSGFVNEPSDEVLDDAKGKAVWEVSETLVGM